MYFRSSLTICQFKPVVIEMETHKQKLKSEVKNGLPQSCASTKFFKNLTRLPFSSVSNMYAILISLILIIPWSEGFPEQGKWSAILNESEQYFGVYKSLFKGSKIYVWIDCKSLEQDMSVKINWQLRETPCWEEYGTLDLLTEHEKKEFWKWYYTNPDKSPEPLNYEGHYFYKPPEEYEHRCDSSINLREYGIVVANSSDISVKTDVTKRTVSESVQTQQLAPVTSKNPVFTVPKDGVYLLVVHIESSVLDDSKSFQAEVKVQMKGEHGFLSATEWPLLLFYGGSCILYVVYGLAWLILSFCQWRDLLRIQFWIGAVIFLGMVEMAVFYAEYQSINSTGVSVTGAVLIAEIISCGKRTLARMLVVIVSIGFGIVKPRLGSTLHRIIIVGSLYFGLASIEACLRVLHPQNGPSNNRAMLAGIPLSILDAGISYWIFQSLMTTMRTLRLRRNLVKLNLYRHFTNTLVFSLIASVAFMIWSIRFLKTAQCLRDWKEIWVDESYWHMLFSVILLVIMILWRPSNNNQRYSFSPLLDNLDDDEEEDLVVNAAFSGNMKVRPKKNGSSEKLINRNQSVEVELRWVEENIPVDITEGDLPALDSEEELISTKFELSKMQ